MYSLFSVLLLSPFGQQPPDNLHPPLIHNLKHALRKNRRVRQPFPQQKQPQTYLWQAQRSAPVVLVWLHVDIGDVVVLLDTFAALAFALGDVVLEAEEEAEGEFFGERGVGEGGRPLEGVGGEVGDRFREEGEGGIDLRGWKGEGIDEGGKEGDEEVGGRYHAWCGCFGLFERWCQSCQCLL